MGGFLVAVLTGICGAVAAFAMASVAVDWLRISSREGEAGYFAVLMGLFGLVGGVVIAIVVNRFVTAPGFAGSATAFGIALAIVLGIIGLGGAYAWMQNDPAPQMAGRYLKLELEVRGYRGLVLDPKDQDNFRASFVSHYATLDFDRAQTASGAVIIPGEISLMTSQRRVYFGVRSRADNIVFIHFEMPRTLDPERAAWSAWLTAPPDNPPRPETGPDGFAVRYRVAWRDPAPAQGK